jgi:predicted metal-dependent peptidase
MVEPEVHVAVVIDTSGSMGQQDLEECLGEIEGIIKASGNRIGVNVYACDADVAATQRVFSARDVKLAGGGGTDMRVGIDKAQEGKPQPDIIIVLTDGYTPWPDEPIKPRLIIGLCGVERDSEVAAGCPPWAKTLLIERQAA